MRTSKRDNILNYKANEKTYTTICPKKRFPMYTDQIHFLTEKSGRKFTEVHLYYTSEHELFKKEYIFGDQRARQESVARSDHVQANFWKLVNNANFGFDCREKSQNKYLHLIYDKNAKVDVNDANRYEANNCFLDLDVRIKKH